MIFIARSLYLSLIVASIATQTLAIESEPDAKQILLERVQNLVLINQFAQVPLRPSFKSSLLKAIDNEKDLNFFKRRVNQWKGFGKFSLSIAGPEILVSRQGIPGVRITSVQKNEITINGRTIRKENGESARSILQKQFRERDRKSAFFESSSTIWQLLFPVASADMDESKVLDWAEPIALIWYGGTEPSNLNDQSERPPPNVSELAEIYRLLEDAPDLSEAYKPARQITCVKDADSGKYVRATGTFDVAVDTRGGGKKYIPVTFSVGDEGRKVVFQLANSKEPPVEVRTGVPLRPLLTQQLDEEFAYITLAINEDVPGVFDSTVQLLRETYEYNSAAYKDDKFVIDSLHVSLGAMQALKMRQSVCKKIFSFTKKDGPACKGNQAAKIEISYLGRDKNNKLIPVSTVLLDSMKKQLDDLDASLKELENVYLLRERDGLRIPFISGPPRQSDEVEAETDIGVAKLFSGLPERKQLIDPLKQRRETLYTDLENRFGYTCNRMTDICNAAGKTDGSDVKSNSLPDPKKDPWEKKAIGAPRQTRKQLISELNRVNHEIFQAMAESVPNRAASDFATLRTSLARALPCCESFKCRTDTWKQNNSIHMNLVTEKKDGGVVDQAIPAKGP